MAVDFIDGVDAFLAERKGRKETVTVGAGESIILWVLIPLLSRFTGEEQGQIRFQNMRSQDATQAVASGNVDLAVHHSAHEFTKDKRVTSRPLRVKPYGLRLVIRRDLVKGEIKNWKDLEGLEVAISTLEGSGSTRALVESLCGKYPKGPQIGMECTSHPQIIESCKKRYLAGVVPMIADPVFSGEAEEDGLLLFLPLPELEKNKVTLSCSYLQVRKKNSALLEKLVSAL